MNRPCVPYIGSPTPTSGESDSGVCEINRQLRSDWSPFAGSSRVCGAPWPRRSWSSPVNMILTMIQCHRSQNAMRGMCCNLLKDYLHTYSGARFRPPGAVFHSNDRSHIICNYLVKLTSEVVREWNTNQKRSLFLVIQNPYLTLQPAIGPAGDQ